MKTLSIITSLALTSTMAFSFDFSSITSIFSPETTESKSTISPTNILSSLSEGTVSKGLKEALSVGVEYAVDELGKDGGYLNNSKVKIPLPENLLKVEKLLRKYGGDEKADNLIKSMNNAASTAAPKTAKIFAKSISNMSIEDAKTILAGDENSATDYFKKSSSGELNSMIKPIIQDAMKENDVAKYYSTFNDYYNQYGKGAVEKVTSNPLAMGLASQFGADKYIPKTDEENLDDYVTKQAIAGLFTMIADKESEIREKPVARVTSLLKDVFSK